MKSILLPALFAFAGALVLAACAASPKQQTARACGGHDWQSQGISDGAAGFGAGRAVGYQTQCGASFDQAEWDAGRSIGAAQFCTLEGAFRSGIAGTDFKAVCSPPPAGADEAIARGVTYGGYTRDIQARQVQIQEHQIAINRIRRDQSSVLGGDNRGSPTGRVRITLLREEIQRLQREIAALDTERERLVL